MFDNLLAKVFTIFAQVMVKFQPIWDRYKALIGLVVGILIGWFALGYWLFPVEWINATPGHLREDYRSAYLAFSADEFFRTGDVDLLQKRLGLNLPKSKHVPWLAEEGLLDESLQTAIDTAPAYRLEGYLPSLTGLQQISGQDQGILSPGEIPAEEEATTATPASRLLRIVAIVGLVLLAAGAIGIVWYLLAGRNKGATTAEELRTTETSGLPLPPDEYDVIEGDRPVKSFSTPYVLGDDYFDPSFSIEMGSEFLGECGIGISETLGAGDPKKVTAFEAWLFDKSDIRTVTKVLATRYAFEEPDLHEKLEPKGDIVMMRPGEEIVLETTKLRVRARIKELDYAQGASLPANSFVQRVNFEITAWVKNSDEIVAFEES